MVVLVMALPVPVQIMALLVVIVMVTMVTVTATIVIVTIIGDMTVVVIIPSLKDLPRPILSHITTRIKIITKQITR